jgi:hypothetical protein
VPNFSRGRASPENRGELKSVSYEISFKNIIKGREFLNYIPWKNPAHCFPFLLRKKQKNKKNKKKQRAGRSNRGLLVQTADFSAMVLAISLLQICINK